MSVSSMFWHCIGVEYLVLPTWKTPLVVNFGDIGPFLGKLRSRINPSRGFGESHTSQQYIEHPGHLDHELLQ